MNFILRGTRINHDSATEFGGQNFDGIFAERRCGKLMKLETDDGDDDSENKWEASRCKRRK